MNASKLFIWSDITIKNSSDDCIRKKNAFNSHLRMHVNHIPEIIY